MLQSRVSHAKSIVIHNIQDVVELDDQPQLRYLYSLRPATHFWKLPPDLGLWHDR